MKNKNHFAGRKVGNVVYSILGRRNNDVKHGVMKEHGLF